MDEMFLLNLSAFTINNHYVDRDSQEKNDKDIHIEPLINQKKDDSVLGSNSSMAITTNDKECNSSIISTNNASLSHPIIKNEGINVLSGIL